MKLETVVGLLVIGLVMSALFDVYTVQTLENMKKDYSSMISVKEEEIKTLEIQIHVLAKDNVLNHYELCLQDLSSLGKDKVKSICLDMEKQYLDEFNVMRNIP